MIHNTLMETILGCLLIYNCLSTAVRLDLSEALIQIFRAILHLRLIKSNDSLLAFLVWVAGVDVNSAHILMAQP